MTDIYQKKQQLRNAMKIKLKCLLDQKIPDDETALIFYCRLMDIPKVVDAKTIMLYLNTKTEVPTLPLLPRLFWQKDCLSTFISEECSQKSVIRNIIIPYCVERDIRLYQLRPPQWSPFDKKFIYNDLKPGRFGILEPNDSFLKLESFNSSWNAKFKDYSKLLDVVLVPGLAFDRNGHRLGRGAGFYDRFLKQLKPRTLLIGLAYDQQLLDDIPVEPHDFPLHLIITPTQTFCCPQYKILH